jgi:hypothetical protein
MGFGFTGNAMLIVFIMGDPKTIFNGILKDAQVFMDFALLIALSGVVPQKERIL